MVVVAVVEVFAGTAGIASHVHRRGVNAVALDYCINAAYDITTAFGFKLHVMAVCCTEHGFKIWSGIESTSWVWIGRKSTGRSAAHPLGHAWSTKVQQGNAHMRRQVVLSMLIHFLGGKQVIEQPLSSLLNFVSLVKRMLQLCHMTTTVTWLGCYSGATPKPLKLWSSHSLAAGLARRRPRMCKERLSTMRIVAQTKNGKKLIKKAVTGIRSKLKQSSAYPQQFCNAVADIMADC